MTSNLGNLANAISSVVEEIVDDRIKSNFAGMITPADSTNEKTNSAILLDLIKALEKINEELELQKKIIEDLVQKSNSSFFSFLFKSSK